MKEFDFILNREPVPEKVEMLHGLEDMKNNIIDAIREGAELSLTLPLENRLNGKTKLVKIAKNKESYYVMIQPVKPIEVNMMLADAKYALFTYTMDSVPFGFLTKYITYKKDRDNYIYSFPVRIFKLQRRKHYRLTLDEKCMIYIKLKLQGRELIFPGIDISEGGVSFYSNHHLISLSDGGTGNYDILMIMPDGRRITSEIIVRRVSENIDNEKYQFEIGAQIMDVDYDDQDYIAQFVFEQQQRMATIKEQQQKDSGNEVDQIKESFDDLF